MKKFILLKVIISIIILCFLVKFVRYREILSAFQKADPRLMAAGLILFIPNIGTQIIKWRFLLRLENPSIKLIEVVKSLFAGFSVGVVTPGRLGEVSRAVFIEGNSKIKIFGYTIIDKMYALLITVLFGLCAVTYLLTFSFKLSVFILIPVLLITFIAIFIVLYFAVTPGLFRSLIYNINIVSPKRDRIKEFLSIFDNFSRGNALIVFFYSFIIFFIYITQFVLFVNSFQGMNIFHGYVASITTIFAKSLLPISFGDLGVREGASVFFFSKFSIESSVAFDSALLLFAVNVLIPAIAGFFLILYSIIQKKNRKNINCRSGMSGFTRTT